MRTLGTVNIHSHKQPKQSSTPTSRHIASNNDRTYDIVHNERVNYLHFNKQWSTTPTYSQKYRINYQVKELVALLLQPIQKWRDQGLQRWLQRCPQYNDIVAIQTQQHRLHSHCRIFEQRKETDGIQRQIANQVLGLIKEVKWEHTPTYSNGVEYQRIDLQSFRVHARRECRIQTLSQSFTHQSRQRDRIELRMISKHLHILEGNGFRNLSSNQPLNLQTNLESKIDECWTAPYRLVRMVQREYLAQECQEFDDVCPFIDWIKGREGFLYLLHVFSIASIWR